LFMPTCLQSTQRRHEIEMLEPTCLWWTDERVNATLTREYVVEHLDPVLRFQLHHSLPFGDGLTDDTYLDWIVDKGRRIFLILSDIGIPERIFSVVAESLDDEDLPFALQDVTRLRLSPTGDDAALNLKFFSAQWRFLVRGIKEGEHVSYGENEGVPVEVATQRTGCLPNRDHVDKVVLSGAVCQEYLRIRVKVGHSPSLPDEEEVVREVTSLRKLSHTHLISVYASYFVDDSVNVLLSGIPEYSLKSFLNDKPPSFQRLTKPNRRLLLLNWPNCLADAVAWLHAHGHCHGSIRPSNILVDATNHIYLGLYDAFDILVPAVKAGDVESYQYAAP